MPTLLFVNACVRGADSRTLALAEQLLLRIKEENKKDMAFKIEEIRLSTENLLPLNY
jgi:FMN-dependent NADH-azoreductase